MRMTPRRFAILSKAQIERTYDEYERMAMEALMQRKAQNEKRVKYSDLFKRPIDGEEAEKKSKSRRMSQEDKIAWLSQFEEFRGKFDNA